MRSGALAVGDALRVTRSPIRHLAKRSFAKALFVAADTAGS